MASNTEDRLLGQCCQEILSYSELYASCYWSQGSMFIPENNITRLNMQCSVVQVHSFLSAYLTSWQLLETTVAHPLWSWVRWFFSNYCLILASVPPQSWQRANIAAHGLQRFSNCGTCPKAMERTCVLPLWKEILNLSTSFKIYSLKAVLDLG